jgi:hypothetical protein
MEKQSFKILVFMSMIAFCAAPLFAQTGNGAPNGAHFNLNIIGVTNPKTQPLTGGDRHTIFVGLGANKKGGDVVTNIYLTQGPFAVCDGNGFDPATACDGSPVASLGAVFQLPCDLVTDTCTGGDSQAYTIWARALGKPGGNATVTTCEEDTTTTPPTTVCATDNPVVLVRGHGQQTFKDVTKQLTTIDGDSIFNDLFNLFFWQYDNFGLKLAQLRFYPQ